ncbi:MAG: NAD(P)/FAD-dependent oxidoreductase [Proteobacteria bacterium]|jgi:menaquinone-9 beta-reductase|nr:NAD(P)/FAD-dependent oxidoreductase [Pseudomonadota bacterium]
MSNYDVLIVGGGPAGSSLAWKLRDSGLSVAILDKAHFPRDKICAGWVTPAVLEELAIDPDAYGLDRTLQPITGFRISQMGGREVETRYGDEVVSYGIRRCEFDDYLLQRSGAELLLGRKFKSMQKTDSGWRVNDEIETRLVVGAGGHFCPVARALGARPGSGEITVTAQEIEFEMTPPQLAECKAEGEIPELYFTRDLVGYGWVFRKGNYLNIGLGREDSTRLSEHVEAFVRFLQEQGRIPARIPGKFQGHAYLLYPKARRDLLQDQVLLIGDAAGLAYANSGEGIRPAVESGLYAGYTIAQANGDYRRENLQAYVDLMTLRFGERQPGPDIFDRLPAGLKRLIARQLMQNHWFTRNVVMDNWFLHNNVPPLGIEFRGQSVA